MRGPEHLAFAVVTTGGALFAVSHGHVEIAAPAVAVVAAAGVGSLVPDIDHPQAWISNRIPATLLAFGLVFVLGVKFAEWSVAHGGAMGLGAALGTPLLSTFRPQLGWAWLAMTLGIVLLAVAMLVAAFVEHRGPTHSLTVGVALAAVVCIGVAIAGQPWTLGLWFGWGYLSHLLTDMITPMGCPAFLWPWREGDRATWRGSVPTSMPKTRPVALDTRSPTRNAAANAVGESTSAEDSQADLAPTVGPSPADDAPPSTPSQKSCPKCGGALIVRQAKRGAHAGNRFLGCANYPRCRYIEDLAH